MAKSQFWRDSSERLTYLDYSVAYEAYAELCARVAERFDLDATAELLPGPDGIYWEFQRDRLLIGIDWDIWSGLMVVAKSPEAEQLVREIGRFLAAQDGQSDHAGCKA